MSGAFYNEIEPYAAAWLRNLIREGLIADGDVCERSIVDLRPADLAGFTQCHFFAGIGVWSHALRFAGWPDDRPVWTGSCPCQPFSSAGQRKGAADERHLWPVFLRLIEACQPPVVFGEQVASSEVVGSELEASFIVAVQAGDFARANRIAKQLSRKKGFHYHRRWADAVRADFQAADYAFWMGVYGAHSVGAPHIRQRLWWVGERLEHASRDGRGERGAEPGGRGAVARRGAGGLADADAAGQRIKRVAWLRRPELHDADGRGADGGVGARPGPTNGLWRDADWLHCRDGRWRPVEPGTFPLAHGAPARVGRLRAYGNAIVAPVAAEVIQAHMECRP